MDHIVCYHNPECISLPPKLGLACCFFIYIFAGWSLDHLQSDEDAFKKVFASQNFCQPARSSCTLVAFLADGSWSLFRRQNDLKSALESGRLCAETSLRLQNKSNKQICKLFLRLCGCMVVIWGDRRRAARRKRQTLPNAENCCSHRSSARVPFH